MTAFLAALEFRRRYGREPKIAVAPGRVNLIGEHTDYNDGFVLPVAIDRFAAIAYSTNENRTIRGYSLAEGEERSLSMDELSPSRTWLDYAAGVVHAHREHGIEIPGMDFVVGGDLPIGAGLSSSAAFELAVARAVFDLASVPWDPMTAARLAQRAENEFVGMPCGIMDPMASALSRAGCAMLLDCRSLDFDVVPLPKSLLVVVMDTGTRRALASSGYEERRRSCEEAAALLGVRALRDASPELAAQLPGVPRKRALHVVQENARTVEMASALRASDEGRIGALMRDSHASLRDLFEVSSPALDAMVEIAARHPAAVGARMTGGGFGGSAVALVRASGSKEFLHDVWSAYRSATGNLGTLHSCRAVGGAFLG
ncbi:MAG TPA: galactokinase [Vicinamibacteria bacterium]